MARAVFVKKARKDNSAVKAGESYWWWSFRFGGKHYSKARPRPSQLTQSDFTSQILGLGEEIEDLDSVSVGSAENLESIRDDIAQRIRDLADEQRDKKENMPEGLQEGPTGELLESRADEAESMADELENIDINEGNYEGEASNPEDPSVEYMEWLQEIIEEVQNVSYNGE